VLSGSHATGVCETVETAVRRGLRIRLGDQYGVGCTKQSASC
jgi:hypothetical protein